MFGFKRRKLMRLVDQESVRRAIRDAETRTSGEIRVSVSPYFWGDVRKVAEKAFVRLGMTNTAQRNGILLFIVPGRRRFAVLGDAGIHEKVGQEFWDHVAAALSDDFHQARYTEGLVRAIAEVGERLAEHFPYDPATDHNELPDGIDFGRTGTP